MLIPSSPIQVAPTQRLPALQQQGKTKQNVHPHNAYPPLRSHRPQLETLGPPVATRDPHTAARLRRICTTLCDLTF
ncbi:hypothetical protein BJX68DRAFT_238273 [Aspergillus pseudodeflectus]|uniref:Uncharacterized protein n=1 Tax=Aspergillus pseudodeflectus TaxID=176178 RepID=A0ABR4KA07_9EURO